MQRDQSGGVVVVGSNPAAPTNLIEQSRRFRAPFLFLGGSQRSRYTIAHTDWRPICTDKHGERLPAARSPRIPSRFLYAQISRAMAEICGTDSAPASLIQ